MERLERGISLAGPLSMKQIGGALTYLRVKKRFYFAMDEVNHKISYYKEEADFIKKKDPIDEFPLQNVVFTTSPSNQKAFTIHTSDKRFELEADNERSCECWMEALARRRGFPGTELPIAPPPPRRRTGARARSHSLPSESALVNKRNGGLAVPSPRKYSCNSPRDSDCSTFALSVLEEKLRRLGAFSHTHPWVEDSETECSEDTATEEPIGAPVAPSWLDEWVHKWLHQQQPYLSETPKHRATRNSLASSTETSPYNSPECSSNASEMADHDEITKLRVIDNRQKERIHQLNLEKRELNEQIDQLRKQTEENTIEGRDLLANQNKFLNGEVLRLNKRCTDLEAQLRNTSGELGELRDELECYKREYVFVLQSCIRIPLQDNNSLDIVQVKLYGGDVHRKRVYELLTAAREEDPSLPTFQSVQAGSYVDGFGFRHCHPDPALAIHYIATQLHQHYSERLETAHEHRRRWKVFLENHATIPLNKDTKQLCRAGIPNCLRSTVWKLLIHQQVVDMKVQYGRYYFRNLCSLQGGDAERMFCNQHQKQINLDLLRTMPNNVHFMSAHCKGVAQLQQVLRAFCLHNGSLGYCQGMNFLAATALLFVGPEDAFWFLIALTEKFFDKTYFDESLAGAQADQEVLKELLEQKFPRIQHHLDTCEIELATVTLNWFIALFFDAVPFQALLRIWDCFLLEGPKVLFRFSVALLGMHEAEILAKNDTIGIMKIVKAAVKLTYDIDGLFMLAFCDLNPFPSRIQLRAKQLTYLGLLQEKLSRRQQRRDVLTSSCDSAFSSATIEPNDVPISDLTMSPFSEGVGFVVAGNQHIGFIGKVVVDGGISRLNRLDIELDCRIASLVIVREDMVFASLISGYIIALHIDGTQCTILWEVKLSDVALKLLHDENRIIAALANGTITILENVIEKAPTSLELLHVPVGSAPISEAAIVGDLLWLAVACRIVVLNRESLSHVASIYVACSASGSGAPFFEKILCLAPSSYGAFVVTAHSTLIQLWNDNSVCGLLFDISYDHSYRKPSLDEAADDLQEVHISALAFLDNLLWVGTSDGYVMMYGVEQGTSESRYRMQRYPPGRRLLPKNSPPERKSSKMPLCYIPTREETLIDEDANSNAARRVSVVIDKDTNKYSVLVAKMRSKSFNKKNTLPKRVVRAHSMRQPILSKGCSQDSAVSVFSSTEAGLDADDTRRIQAEEEYLRAEKERMLHVLRNSTGSSTVSMEYDDFFELYSEDGTNKRMRQLSVPQQRLFGRKNAQIGPVDIARLRSEGTSSGSSTARATHLRRKDLNFDDPLVVAIQESDECSPSTSSPSPKEDDSGTGDSIVSTVGLSLMMKLKISDRPVRRMMPSRFQNADIMITCAGNYGDEEALLKWYKDPESGLWINDPIQDHLAHRRYSVFSSTPSSPRNQTAQ